MTRRSGSRPTAPVRASRSIGTFVLALALLASAAGLAVVAVGPWRLGVGIVGSALVASSLARTLLPERHAGLLRVRQATADVMAMTALGVTIILLALLVPDQPPL